jgi:hypothetical protein
MNEQNVCYGCCLTPSFLNSPYNCFNYPTFKDIVEGTPVSLTKEETEILKKLGEAWDLFYRLDKKSDCDSKEFVDGIHRLQQLIALRVARRANPEVWAQPE